MKIFGWTIEKTKPPEPQTYGQKIDGAMEVLGFTKYSYNINDVVEHKNQIKSFIRHLTYRSPIKDLNPAGQRPCGHEENGWA